jgi:uncharacterized iron-regulated membrane protein
MCFDVAMWLMIALAAWLHWRRHPVAPQRPGVR